MHEQDQGWWGHFQSLAAARHACIPGFGQTAERGGRSLAAMAAHIP
jgi:hypothetical protein